MPLKDQTQSRKIDHIKICLTEDVNFQKTTGLEKLELLPNNLPEFNFDEIDTSLKFLGKKFSSWKNKQKHGKSCPEGRIGNGCGVYESSNRKA